MIKKKCIVPYDQIRVNSNTPPKKNKAKININKKIIQKYKLRKQRIEKQ